MAPRRPALSATTTHQPSWRPGAWALAAQVACWRGGGGRGGSRPTSLPATLRPTLPGVFEMGGDFRGRCATPGPGGTCPIRPRVLGGAHRARQAGITTPRPTPITEGSCSGVSRRTRGHEPRRRPPPEFGTDPCGGCARRGNGHSQRHGPLPQPRDALSRRRRRDRPRREPAGDDVELDFIRRRVRFGNPLHLSSFAVRLSTGAQCTALHASCSG